LPDLSTIDTDPATNGAEPVSHGPDPISQPVDPLFQRVVTKSFSYIPWVRNIPISGRVMTALRGTTWTMIGYGSSQVLRLGSTLLLARLLAPQSFGLVALVNVFLGGLEMLTDLGIGLDVVQHKRGDDPKFINTAFCIQVIRGIGIWIIATAFAKPFASFYHQPAVVSLAMVASISVLCRGFGGGSVWLLLRHVQLRQLTMLNLISEVGGFVVSVVWALISPTAWALVIGRVTSAVLFVIGSHLIPGHKTAFEWDRTAAKDILAFGTGIFLSSATYFMSGEAERLIMGKFVTVVELGCFSLALSLSGAVSGAVMQVAGRVVFPMIATALRESNDSAVRRYKKARLVFTILSVIVGVGAVAYGPRIVLILLSSKYFMTGWMLQLLGWRAAQDIFAAPTAQLMLASGNSRVAAIANVARMTAMFSGLALAFSKYGIHLAIAVLAFSTLFGYFVYLAYLGKHLRGALWAELSEFGIFVAATVAAAFIPWPWR
jgi:O-antigen/teichoic acid export membrane protein